VTVWDITARAVVGCWQCPLHRIERLTLHHGDCLLRLDSHSHSHAGTGAGAMCSGGERKRGRAGSSSPADGGGDGDGSEAVHVFLDWAKVTVFAPPLGTAALAPVLQRALQLNKRALINTSITSSHSHSHGQRVGGPFESFLPSASLPAS
jgi:hypothetical protein